MSTIGSSGKPQSRRYTPGEKDHAVRMVLALRAELGTTQGTVKRVAQQLGYGVDRPRPDLLRPQLVAHRCHDATPDEVERP